MQTPRLSWALVLTVWILWFPAARVVHAPAPEPMTWPYLEVKRVVFEAPKPPEWGTFCGAKASVRVDYYRPQMMRLCQIVDEVWQEYGARAIVTGHGREQTYEYERLHRIGLAADFRIFNLNNGDYHGVADVAAREVCHRARAEDPRYRVVLFLDDPDHGDHIHGEWRDEEEMSWADAFWQGDEEACP